MNLNELRIGNYVCTSYMKKSVLKVNAIHSDRLYFESIIENFKSDTIPIYVEPIKLTEEILLKFGFNTDYKKGYIGKDPVQPSSCDFVLSYPYRMGEWQSFFAWEFDNYKFQKLEYVHELQNLYFALNESELVFSTEP